MGDVPMWPSRICFLFKFALRSQALQPGDSAHDVHDDPATRNNEGCKSTPVQKIQEIGEKEFNFFSKQNAHQKGNAQLQDQDHHGR